MKIISKIEMKEVQFLGETFHVPPEINFVAVDQDGGIMGFESSPVPDVEWGFWINPDADSIHEMGEVDLEGADWTTTLFAL